MPSSVLAQSSNLKLHFFSTPIPIKELSKIKIFSILLIGVSLKFTKVKNGNVIKNTKATTRALTKAMQKHLQKQSSSIAVIDKPYNKETNKQYIAKK